MMLHLLRWPVERPQTENPWKQNRSPARRNRKHDTKAENAGEYDVLSVCVGVCRGALLIQKTHGVLRVQLPWNSEGKVIRYSDAEFQNTYIQ